MCTLLIINILIHPGVVLMAEGDLGSEAG